MQSVDLKSKTTESSNINNQKLFVWFDIIQRNKPYFFFCFFKLIFKKKEATTSGRRISLNKYQFQKTMGHSWSQVFSSQFPHLYFYFLFFLRKWSIFLIFSLVLTPWQCRKRVSETVLKWVCGTQGRVGLSGILNEKEKKWHWCAH